jgi:heme exporter protein CcmD
MIQFLRMGGYAVYLWPAYGITLLVVVLNILWARSLLARSQADARRRLSMKGNAE